MDPDLTPTPPQDPGFELDLSGLTPPASPPQPQPLTPGQIMDQLLLLQQQNPQAAQLLTQQFVPAAQGQGYQPPQPQVQKSQAELDYDRAVARKAELEASVATREPTEAERVEYQQISNNLPVLQHLARMDGERRVEKEQAKANKKQAFASNLPRLSQAALQWAQEYAYWLFQPGPQNQPPMTPQEVLNAAFAELKQMHQYDQFEVLDTDAGTFQALTAWANRLNAQRLSQSTTPRAPGAGGVPVQGVVPPAPTAGPPQNPKTPEEQLAAQYGKSVEEMRKLAALAGGEREHDF